MLFRLSHGHFVLPIIMLYLCALCGHGLCCTLCSLVVTVLTVFMFFWSLCSCYSLWSLVSLCPACSSLWDKLHCDYMVSVIMSTISILSPWWKYRLVVPPLQDLCICYTKLTRLLLCLLFLLSLRSLDTDRHMLLVWKTLSLLDHWFGYRLNCCACIIFITPTCLRLLLIYEVSCLVNRVPGCN